MAYTFNEMVRMWMRVLLKPKQGVGEIMSKNPTLSDGIITGAVAGGIAGLIGGFLGFIITSIFGLGFLDIVYLILDPILGAIGGALGVLIGAIIYYIIAVLFGGNADFERFCGVFGVASSSIFLFSLAASLTQTVIPMAAEGAMFLSVFSGSYGAVVGAFRTLMIVQAIFLIIELLIMVYGIFIISKVIEAVYGFGSGKALLVAAIPIIIMMLVTVVMAMVIGVFILSDILLWVLLSDLLNLMKL